MTGTIKTVNRDKGFGFIIAADGTEFFFHRSALKNHPFESLRNGLAVSFQHTHTPKGPRAEEILVEAR